MGPVTVGAFLITAVSVLIFGGLILAGMLGANGRREW